ncbi:MAG: Rid family hydrolase, partial [Halieaceae bacterium]|nr:Rid family hydrolase [Halieaceae bacterium]
MKTSVLILSAALAATGVASAGEVTHLNESGAMPPGLPFSEAVRVDDTLYLSGQVATQPGVLELVPGGIEAEARQVLGNVRTVLEANGLGLEDVVKCTVMLADIAEWP